MDKKRVLLVGHGVLAKEFESRFDEVLGRDYALVGALVRRLPDADEAHGLKLTTNLDEALTLAPDYVVEFAGAAAVSQYAEAFLRAGVDFVIASVGALSDKELLDDLTAAAREGKSSLRVLSGAVGGFDVLRTMAVGGETSFSIDNVKAPESLCGAPALAGQSLSQEHDEVVFRGSVREAIEGFPKNVNVAVASALAAGCLETGEVSITSVPGKEDNTHVISASNQIARATIEVSSSPDPKNPRSSTITAWSALALLADLASPVKFF